VVIASVNNLFGSPVCELVRSSQKLIQSWQSPLGDPFQSEQGDPASHLNGPVSNLLWKSISVCEGHPCWRASSRRRFQSPLESISIWTIKNRTRMMLKSISISFGIPFRTWRVLKHLHWLECLVLISFGDHFSLNLYHLCLSQSAYGFNLLWSPFQSEPWFDRSSNLLCSNLLWESISVWTLKLSLWKPGKILDVSISFGSPFPIWTWWLGTGMAHCCSFNLLWRSFQSEP